jgi:hypothetical protein
VPPPPPPKREPLGVASEPLPRAKTKYEKFYNLLSDVEDESNITPSDEKLSEPINIIKSSSGASNVDYCC